MRDTVYFKYGKEADITIGEVKSNKKNIILTILVSSLTFLVLIGVSWYYYKDYIVDLITRPQVVLTSSEIELEVNSEFNAKDYIKSVPSGYTVIYPTEVDTTKLGEYTVSYKLKTKYGKEIQTFLKIRVVDTEAPELELTKEEDVIEEGQDFSCRVYIKEVRDNYDLVTPEDVQCSSTVDYSKDHEEIEYFLKDSSDNFTKKTLLLKINKKPVEKVEEKHEEKQETEEKEPENQETSQETPGIYGVHDITVGIGTDGSTILQELSKGVSGTSDISIDATNVNTTQEGSYPVYFNGADGSTATVYVHIK